MTAAAPGVATASQPTQPVLNVRPSDPTQAAQHHTPHHQPAVSPGQNTKHQICAELGHLLPAQTQM